MEHPLILTACAFLMMMIGLTWCGYRLYYRPGRFMRQLGSPVITDERGRFALYKVVDPSFHNWSGLAYALRGQQISDQFPSVDWVRVFGRYARRANPLLGELLRPMEYDWVTVQAEYSTDVLFRKRSDLQELMPRLLQYSTL